MPNLLLLCHGGLMEFTAFDLAGDQSVQYRGNYGAPLGGSAARAITQALLDNPLVTDAELATAIPNYDPHLPLEGPGTYAPDIALSGDDDLLCFMMNLTTRRWMRLGSAWRSRLSAVIRSLDGNAIWLNLLCCTPVPGANVPRAQVDPTLQVDDWNQLLR